MRHLPPDPVLTSLVDNPLCPVQITCGYLQKLGEHAGSLQPTCQAGSPNHPHPTRVVAYTNALKVFICFNYKIFSKRKFFNIFVN